IKRAQVQAAETALKQAHAEWSDLNAGAKQGVVSQRTIREARDKVTTLEAQVLIKRAEAKEPEVRLKQARRRLAALEAKAPSTAPARERSRITVPDPLRDFGTVQRGRVLTHRFKLINDSKKDVRITGVRTTAAFVTADVERKLLGPGQQTDV